MEGGAWKWGVDTTALCDISNISQEAATGQSWPQKSTQKPIKPPHRVDNKTPPRLNIIPDSPPRVNWKEPIISDSNNPTSPKLIKNTRWNLQRKTRANTPTLFYE